MTDGGDFVFFVAGGVVASATAAAKRFGMRLCLVGEAKEALSESVRLCFT